MMVHHAVAHHRHHLVMMAMLAAAAATWNNTENLHTKHIKSFNSIKLIQVLLMITLKEVHVPHHCLLLMKVSSWITAKKCHARKRSVRKS